MKWQFDNDKPIYLQIVEILKADIISGKYCSGEKFPSVRELAVIASVNPNTMQKALVCLETDGFLITNRTTGRIVTENFSKITNEKQSITKQKTTDFLAEMYKLGYKKDEIIKILEEEPYELSGN